MEKSVDAFRTISEVADDLSLPQHVLRFWETRFPQIRPLKRAGGRRYYRPADVVLLRTIRQLLYEEGFTIKGVQKLLKEQGTRAVRAGSVQMPVDLARLDQADVGSDIAARDAAADDAAAHDAQADDAPADDAAPTDASTSVHDALYDLPSGFTATRLSRHDLGALRDALTAIDECERILKALRRPRD